MSDTYIFKPCPFCGGKACFDNGHPQRVFCTECGASIQTALYDGKDRLFKKWNKRAEKQAEAYWYSVIDARKHLKVKDGIAPYNCACSNCKEWLTGSDELPVFGRFCPNRGAKMEGEQDG